MPSPFHGISTMSSALRTFQRQLDVTGNNIANVNTPGYTRQTVDLKEQDPTYFQQGKMLSIGNGVNIAAVSRIRDMFLEGRRVVASSDQGKYQASTDGLNRVESTLLEPGDNGISAAMNKFWNSWSGLASNPSNQASRTEVQQAGQTLANRVRGTYNNLESLKSQQTATVDQTLKDIQSIADQIGALNTQIKQRNAQGAEPNELLDERDQAVRDLASLVDINVQKFGDGSYTIYIGQITIVDPEGSKPVPTTWNPATGTLSNANGSTPIKSGALSGLFDSINKINSYQGQLDTLANNLRTEINAVHGTGVNKAGATGLKFFNDVASGPQNGAIDFDLDSTGVTGPPASVGVKTDAQMIASGTSGATGDGGLALSISRIRDQKITAIGTQRFSDYYGNMVATIGRDSKYAESNLTTQGAVVEQIDSQIQSVSGVSLDDEMANMLRFQRSYQAAAKTLSTMDQVTQDLINMLNR